MTGTVYLEPINLTRGVEADALRAAGLSAQLAGGPVSFSAVRLWQRQAGGGAADRIISLDQARRDYPDLLAALTAPRALPFGLSAGQCHVMGILNVTPDSFSDGGRFNDLAAAVAQADQMMGAGAGLIDIGGESTRPGAAPVSLDEELSRTVPVIGALRDGGCAGGAPGWRLGDGP